MKFKFINKLNRRTVCLLLLFIFLLEVNLFIGYGIANKDREVSEETRQKIRKANLGKKLSKETCKKISKALVVLAFSLTVLAVVCLVLATLNLTEVICI